MSFKRINNITGWAVCLIACAVYIMTMEATGSFWDTGEFASSAYKLQIPHPPGAPLFVLIGRLFMAPFGPETAATGINLMSALASGFTILFLFWSITHFARKIVNVLKQNLVNPRQPRERTHLDRVYCTTLEELFGLLFTDFLLGFRELNLVGDIQFVL